MPRILVAVERGGVVDVQNIGKPAALVAFGDEFGKSAPTSFREVAWLAHRAIVGKDGPAFDEWLETLDELTAEDGAVAAAQRAKHGQLSPCERLEAMTAAEFVELVLDGEPGVFEQLVAEAADELEAKQSELDEQVRAIAAQRTLEASSEAELEALSPEQLAELRELAAKAPAQVEPVPTTPAPAMVGGAE